MFEHKKEPASMPPDTETGRLTDPPTVVYDHSTTPAPNAQTGKAQAARRPYPTTDDYLGKGRVAACCARRRYHLDPDPDEMDELINHAASVYWHHLVLQDAPPARAFVAARDRSANYYFRQMRCLRPDRHPHVHIVHLDDPLGAGDDRTYLDALAEAAADVVDVQRLQWLSHEDLVATLVRGRVAAGVSQRAISYARNRGTLDHEATLIRLAAQGHTNAGIATILDTTEGTIKSSRQSIRRWLQALAHAEGVADQVEPWDRSGGNPSRAASIQKAYPNQTRPG